MKTVLVCLVVLVAAQVSAQSLQDCYNGIGIFTSPAPDLDAITDTDVSYHGPIGPFTVYVVLINPYNENLSRPIHTVGGFEFRVVYSPWLQVTPSLPAGVDGFLNFPEVIGSADLPVVDRTCLLFSLEIAVFIPDPAHFYLVPLSNLHTQSIPGEMAIADADDGLSLSRAAPSSQQFDTPVFCLYCGIWDIWGAEKGYWNDCAVLPTQPTTWGSIKAMYR